GRTIVPGRVSTKRPASGFRPSWQSGWPWDVGADGESFAAARRRWTLRFAIWTILAVYLVVGVWSRLRFLGAFASPVVFAIGVFALMPGLDPQHGAHS